METKIVYIIVALFVATVSCKETHTSNNDEDIRSVDTTTLFLLKHDSLFCKVEYENADSSLYRVIWGSTSFLNKTKETFEVLGNGLLQLKGYNKDAIVLIQRCGTSCTYNVVLPLQKDSMDRVYMFVKALDITNNLIAYIPEDDSVFIRVENFITGHKMNILEKNICSAAFKGDCIDSSYFNNGNFIYSWNGSKWTSSAPNLMRKKVPIRLY
jgi:hypothetical protein